MSKIHGGFILVARQRDKSPIAHCPPHYREIWDYLLRKATHEDVVVSGTQLKRGQCFVSYPQIQEDLRWYVGYRKETYKKHHCEKAMKYLVAEQMVETSKTTRGMIVTIVNYDNFQNIKNYESDDDSDNKATTKRQRSDTINNEHKEQKEHKEKKPYGEFKNVFLSDKEISQLHERFGEKEADDEIENLSQYVQSKGRKYKDHYATILNWRRKKAKEVESTGSDFNRKLADGRIVR